jgi:CBS domain containing-hemolysin-like protein
MLNSNPTTSHALAGVLGFAVVSFFHTVLGELAPKSVSIQKAETVALWCAMPLHGFYVVSFPVIWLLNTTANGFLHLFGLRSASEAEASAHTEEEIRMIVSSSQEHGILEEHEAVLVENVLDYTDRVVREIMTPRNDVSVLFTDQTLEEATQFVLKEGYTRYPLCHDEKDHVIGVIHIRDIFALHCSGEQKTLEEFVREALIIPETLSLNEVRMKFQKSGTQIAIIVDEYGAFSGIVTLEDLVEEVFGEFRDEFDEQEPESIRSTADGLEFDAGMLAEEALEALGIEDDDCPVEGIDTLGGLVFSLLGDRPEVGDTVVIDGYQLKVIEVEGLRITRIKASKHGVGEKPSVSDHDAKVAAS